MLVFEEVYRQHHEDQVPLLKDPISQTLHPFVRQNLFRRIRFSTLAHFLAFCKKVDGKPKIICSVQRVVIAQKPGRPVKISLQHESTIFAFFAQAHSVKRICSHNAALSALVVSGRFGRNLSKDCSIEELFVHHLAIEEESLARTLEPILLWKALRLLTVEYEYGIIASSEGGRSEGREVESRGVIQQHEGITVLTLSFPRAVQETGDIVAWFPKLKFAHFFSSSVPEFAPLLDSLSDTVTTLKLGTTGASPTPTSPATPNHSLLNFRNLRHLSLDANILTPHLVDSLFQRLSVLYDLTLLPNSVPQASDIEKLIRSRPSTLEHLLLKHLAPISRSDHLDLVSSVEWFQLKTLAQQEQVNLGKQFYDTIDAMLEHFARFIPDRRSFDFEEDEEDEGGRAGRGIRVIGVVGVE